MPNVIHLPSLEKFKDEIFKIKNKIFIKNYAIEGGKERLGDK